MRTVRGKKGPFGEQPHFTLNEIDEMCASELRSASLLPSSPEAIRIERFVEKRFGVSPSYDDLPDGVLGFTEFGTSGVTAVVLSRAFEVVDGSKPLERRLRTTLAHEAGHGLMHAHLFALGEKPRSLFDDDTREPTILCRDIMGEAAPRKGYDGRWWEFQANRAIGGLLMPRRLVEQAAADFLTASGLLGLRVLRNEDRERAARSLAEIFDVNAVVARYRLEELFPS